MLEAPSPIRTGAFLTVYPIKLRVRFLFFIVKLLNPNLDFFKEESTTKKNVEEFSDKEISDSIDKREERIKALKEVGKKLGGWLNPKNCFKKKEFKKEIRWI